MRALIAAVYDALRDDVCLAELLDPWDRAVTHGAEFCDQPPTADAGLPIRRATQAWDADFTRAIVTFGGFSRSPVAPEYVRWEEQWSFRVGIYAHRTVEAVGGGETAGDLHVWDIHDHVVRILAWGGNPPCPTPGIRVLRTDHDGDVTPITWDTERGFWTLTTQFRWIVLSRGLRAGVPTGCC